MNGRDSLGRVSRLLETLEPRLLLAASMPEPIWLGLPADWEFPTPPASVDVPFEKGPEYDEPRLARALQDLRADIVERLAADPGADLSTLSWTYFRQVTPDGRIQVVVYLEDEAEPDEQALRAAGLEVELALPGPWTFQGWVPWTHLDALAEVPGVERVVMPCRALPNSGSVTSAGDGILNADDLRAYAGVSGTGCASGSSPTECCTGRTLFARAISRPR